MHMHDRGQTRLTWLYRNNNGSMDIFTKHNMKISKHSMNKLCCARQKNTRVIRLNIKRHDKKAHCNRNNKFL